MQLLERTPLLEALRATSERARDGHGALVFVASEAGVGKTALVAHFAQAQSDGARVLWGKCDAMSTPSPFGALQDIAQQLAEAGRPLSPLAAPHVELFAGPLDARRSARRRTRRCCGHCGRRLAARTARPPRSKRLRTNMPIGWTPCNARPCLKRAPTSAT